MRTTGERPKLRTLFSTPSVIAAYVGSGLQLFIAGSLFAWLPSYLNRTYGLAPDRAAVTSACEAWTTRRAPGRPRRRRGPGAA